MDENQNSLTRCKIENSFMMQQLSSGLEKIVIDQIDYQYGIRNKCFLLNKINSNMVFLSSEQGTSESCISTISNNSKDYCKGTISLNMSLETIEEMENQDEMMPLDLSTSQKQNNTRVSRKDTLHEANQQDDIQTAQDDNCQSILGCLVKHEDKNRNRSYQSYSNLINMYCCKCEVISKNVTDCRCYKCLSSLRFQCAKCTSLYKNYVAALNHIKFDCYKLPTYYCSICIYSTYRKPNLVKHIQTNHSSFNESEYPHQCYVCKKKFKKQQHMLKHEKICDNEANLVCQYCPYKTKLNQVLMQHVQNKHQQCIVNNHQCPDCGKKYRDSKLFHRHMKFKCSEIKFFKCDHCNFKIGKKFALIKHIHEVHPLYYERFNLSN